VLKENVNSNEKEALARKE